MTTIWQNAPYSEGTLLTLLALADWADDDGQCFPSLEQIAEKARLSYSGARYTIDRLVEDGVLIKIPGNGRGNRSQYQITCQYLPPLDKRKVPVNKPKGASNTVKKGASRTDPNKEEPSVTVNIEPSCARNGYRTPKPTLEEVTAYCQERRNGIDPSQWYDHYSSNGWRVGRNPMKDWKAAVRTWERMRKETTERKRNGNEEAISRIYQELHPEDDEDSSRNLFEFQTE